ncbi:ABC transporter ATP-binding protein [Aquicoccus sp. G2-2]|uniref:ABC transporter ATP-binding protein n=1 Tax=Aquicoccus sp. G2-2 TaxID=3092120 RepID=UPI002AE04AFA|nr:ABC transporter ATP-binding protein [Aquicoccus sp. G2-2]MEA1114585.1 ABC transporter ATP-binding protein [Aquicoccus sp. G2-2]
MIAALLLPIALIEVVTLAGIRLFFLTLNSTANTDTASGIMGGLVGATSPLLAALSVGFGLILWLILRGGISHWIWITIIRTLTRVQARVLNRLFLKFVSLPMRDRLEVTISEQKHVLLLSAQAMFHQVLFPLSSLLVEAVIAVAIVATLLVIAPIATLLLVGWIGVLFTTYHLLLRAKAASVGQQRWHALNAMRAVADGALGDLRWVKITHAEQTFSALFHAQTTAYSEALAKDRALTLLPRYVADIAIVSSILILVAYYSLGDVEQGNIYSGIALFAAGAIRLLPAFYRVISLSHSLNTHAPDLGQVVEHLESNVQLPQIEPEPDNRKPPFLDTMTFQEIAFRYPGQDRDILADIALTLSAGDRVLITGPSGAGKSTFLSLFLGLLEPTRGCLLLDGRRASVLDAVRASSVALVSQDPFITTGTVADNIAFPHAADTLDNQKALGLLRDLGLEWPLDRSVGENGTRLSGGERQRLALARALYLSPDCLVLDEATSQMDEAAAARAYELVFETCPNATVLISTHQHLPTTYYHRHLVVGNRRISEVLSAEPRRRG